MAITEFVERLTVPQVKARMKDEYIDKYTKLYIQYLELKIQELESLRSWEASADHARRTGGTL